MVLNCGARCCGLCGQNCGCDAITDTSKFFILQRQLHDSVHIKLKTGLSRNFMVLYFVGKKSYQMFYEQ
jgi:hypothetical protein